MAEQRMGGAEKQDEIAGQGSLILPARLAMAIIDHAQRGYPEEVCGLVAGAAGRATALYPGRNTSPTPTVAYELDHETLARQIEFEEQGLALAAIYHSHPDGPEIPSPTDVQRAYYPDSIYLICSLADPDRPGVRGFQIRDGRVSEVELVGQQTGDSAELAVAPAH